MRVVDNRPSVTLTTTNRLPPASASSDLVLAPGNGWRQQARVKNHGHNKESPTEFLTEAQEGQLRAEEATFAKILALLRAASGCDFSNYRRKFVQRRILRRMALHDLHRISDYLEMLKLRREELQALADDLLIDVTGFFRDPEAFKALAKEAIPRIISGKKKGEVIRVWVPGCSTGEEVYSIAICFMEQLQDNPLGLTVRIFGTDIKNSVLRVARQGLYPESIKSDMPGQRLERFFSKTAHGYHVTKSIRNVCIFAQQDILKDPPIANLDLLSCRNLLIYLEPAVRNRMLQRFDYALKPGGFLVLGASETPGDCRRYFCLFDPDWKLYRKMPISAPLGPAVPSADDLTLAAHSL